MSTKHRTQLGRVGDMDGYSGVSGFVPGGSRYYAQPQARDYIYRGVAESPAKYAPPKRNSSCGCGTR